MTARKNVVMEIMCPDYKPRAALDVCLRNEKFNRIMGKVAEAMATAMATAIATAIATATAMKGKGWEGIERPISLEARTHTANPIHRLRD